MSGMFVGIDLGTSNSAIATYKDGEIRVWKDLRHPRLHDVTASAIWVGPNGEKEVGNPASSKASRDPDHVITNFKRYIGTNTKMPVKGLGEEWTPEQCSAEILRKLYSYIPPEEQTECAGTVVTVPAAFDQAQKKATLDAVESAGVGQVKLLQEPVAAVMAASLSRTEHGHIVVYDIGGGTFDVAVAEWRRRGITLHAHGGVKMLGGRDIDRAISERIIAPWLEDQFNMPKGWRSGFKDGGEWAEARRLCDYFAEMAKIRLSRVAETTIVAEEHGFPVKDGSGVAMHLHIPIKREQLDELMDAMVEKSIAAVREVLAEGGFEPTAMDELVFIGGPTHYEPLRRKVRDALGIPASTETNPMTAVALGAAMFAESVDWTTGKRAQERPARERGEVGDVRYDLNYDRRVTANEAKLRVTPISGCDGATLEIVSKDTGWSTGEIRIDNKAAIRLNVGRMGENKYKAVIRKGTRQMVADGEITIVKSLVSVDVVPLTESTGISVRDGSRGREKMLWFARRGASLPCSGSLDVFAAEQLEAGEDRSINFKVYTGEHDDPADNQARGILQIRGEDLDEGRIEEDAKMVCDFHIDEGGAPSITVKVPDVRQEFRSGKDFYRHLAGAPNFREMAEVVRQDAKELRERVVGAQSYVDDGRLRRALVHLDEVEEMQADETDPETIKGHYETLMNAKSLLAQSRKDHKHIHLQAEVDLRRTKWADEAAAWAEEGTKKRVAKLFDAACKAAAAGSDECLDHIEDIRRETMDVLWKEDWYIIRVFKWLRETIEKRGGMGGEGSSLIKQGERLMEMDDVMRMRGVVVQMLGLVHGGRGKALLLDPVNIRAE